MATETLTQVQQEVLAAQRARFDATIAKDQAALERLMAEDLTYVHTSAKLESRAENVGAVLATGAYKSFDLAHLLVRVEGDTAIITGTADITFARPDGDTMLPIRFTDVWARRDGAWREIAWQSTRRPEA
ncbi:MAG: nuclear transport factor 2 family protein [Dehalococcoidia bacterium]|nr:nuclear transport factor 2 family protein [Dehalococcoidia bacterium]